MSLMNPMSPFMPNYGSSSPLNPSTPMMPMGQMTSPYSTGLPSTGLGGGSALGGTGLSGDMPSALMQIMQMIMMLMMQLIQALLGGSMGGMSGGGSNGQNPGDFSQSLSAGGHGGGHGGGGHGFSGPGSYQGSQSGGYNPGQNNPPDNGNSNGGYTPPSGGPPPSSGGRGTSNSGSGAGWNKNVSVMASSSADQETVDYYSGGNLVGGYLHDLEQGMDSGQNINQANAGAQAKNKDGAMSANVNPNSLVKGKGGNAIVVTGDNYGSEQDATQLADKLKKDYGMNVQVIHNASPNQLKAAIQQMGQQNGQQAMVAVLAHGAKDGSGKNDGNIALGKGNGDQWLHESDLKSWVNQYLSPSYGNVNVLFNSCFSGNFVQ